MRLGDQRRLRASPPDRQATPGREPYVVPACFGKPYTSVTPVTVTEEVTSPTTFGGTQDVMIAVTVDQSGQPPLVRLANWSFDGEGVPYAD